MTTKTFERIVQYQPDAQPCREVYEFNPETGEYFNSHMNLLSPEDLAFYTKEMPNRYLVRHMWRDPSFREGDPSPLEFAQSQPKCKGSSEKGSVPYRHEGQDMPGGRPGGAATFHFRKQR